MSAILYYVAIDPDEANPNPHAWVIDYGPFTSFDKAVKHVEEALEEMRGEGYEEEELFSWIILSSALERVSPR